MSDISFGNVLMLSQVAWRAGRSFRNTSSKSLPYAFREVELELSRVSKSLKLLAEALFSEEVETVLDQASLSTQEGIYAVIELCKNTLDSLQSRIEQYQHAPKKLLGNGGSTEKTWSELVLKNYSSLLWTTDGGTLRDLRDLLHMNTSTTALVGQALESKSLDRLEWVVAPIFEQIRFMEQSERDMSDNVEDIERVVEGLMSDSPAISTAFDRVNSVSSQMSELALDTSDPKWNGTLYHRPRNPSKLDSPAARKNTELSSPSSSPGNLSGSDIASEAGAAKSSVGQPTPVHGPSALPPSMRKLSERRVGSMPAFPPTPEIEPGVRRSASISDSVRLPSAAQSFSMESKGSDRYSHLPQSKLHEPLKLHRSTSTASQQSSFEKALFKNSAIYCDLRGQVVEFVKPSDDDPTERTLEVATKDCRICVVRRREAPQNGQESFTTSIWAFSDDLAVRFQQKLPDSEDVVPFPSYFQNEKLSITIPTEIVLHDIAYGSPPLRNIRSSWVNYVLEDEVSATSFQNTLFGHNLIGTFKTEKTLRIHDGITGALSYQEQMCAMETLRIWQEDATYGIFLMVHFTAHFRSRGYLTCYLNDKHNPIKVKDDVGTKAVKIRGLKIPAEDPITRIEKRAAGLKEGKKITDSKKLITGAKIEFKDEEEKESFLGLVRSVQCHVVTLPGH